MDDYISRAAFRQELIDTPFYPRCETTPDMLTTIQDRLNDTLELLDHFPAADVRPVWISVADKLPEKERAIYLCFTDAGVVCECRWTNNRFGLGESENWGWSLMDTPQYQKVTHWMPLPEPPEGGADG